MVPLQPPLPCVVSLHPGTRRRGGLFRWRLSETELASGAAALITVLGVNERQGIRLGATWPILLLFGQRIGEAASGVQDRPFVGWITPEEQVIRRIQGLRFRIECEESEE